MKYTLTIFLTFLLFKTFAQWNVGDDSPLILGGENKVELDPVFTSDSVGNTYIAWTDFRDGNGELYVQKINKRGKSLWTENGVKVGKVISGENFVFTPKSIVEKNGGASVVWQQMPNSANPKSKILVKQEITSTGALVFENPEVIANGLFNETVVNAIITQGVDEANVPFLVYNVLNGSSNIDQVFLRKNGQDKLLFTTGGDGSKVLVDKQNKRLVALIANGTTQATATAYDYAGNQIGQSKIVFSNPFAGNSRIDFITVEKGFTYLARTLSSDFQKRVIAQKLDKDFNRLWGEIGVELGSSSGFDMQLSPNPDGGATMAWIEPNSFENRMMAARVSPAGLVLWQNPIFEGKENTNYFAPNKFASDGNGGCYSLWFEGKGLGFNLHVQHMSSSGQREWGPQGISMTMFNWFSNYRLISHIEGGVIVLYSGSKDANIEANNTYDLYTNYINKNSVYGIEQGLEAVLSKRTYCPTEIIKPGLPTNNYSGFLQYTRGIIELEKLDTLNNFKIPENVVGTFNLFFRNAQQESTISTEISIISPSIPTLTTSSEMTCKETEEEIVMSSSCSTGSISWNTGEKTNQIKAVVSETTTFSVSCNLEGCPIVPTDEVTIEVVEVKVNASAPTENFAGDDIQLISSANAASFFWIGPDNFSSSQQNAVITDAKISNAGLYTVTATDDFGCLGTAQVLVNVSPLLATDRVESSLKIFPNPSQDLLSVSSKEQIKKLSIINNLGQKRSLSISNGFADISSLGAGMYVLKVEFLNGTTTFKKLVKY